MINDLIKAVNNSTISGKHILPLVKTISDEPNLNDEFSDPRFYSFYYYLGVMSQAQSCLHYDVRSGLIASALLAGNSGQLRHFVACETQDSLYPDNFTKSNIGRYSRCQDLSWTWPSQGRFDLITVASRSLNMDKLLAAKDLLAPEGLITVDYISEGRNREAADRLCRAMNRTPTVLNTKYGVYLIER